MTASAISFVATGRSPRSRVVLADGEPLTTTSVAVLKALGVEEGDCTSAAVLLDQIARLEPTIANERALRILGYRERSCAELADRLRADGYSEVCVDTVVERFTSIGLVDDSRFAELFVRSKHAAGWGRRRITDALRRAGVPDPIAAGALQDSSDDCEFERALAFARRRRVSSPPDRTRVASALIRRGFDIDTARRAVREASLLPNGDADQSL